MSDSQAAEVADLLHSAAIHLLRRAGEHDGASGLSAARLSALSVVVFRGPLTIGELAEAEGVRSATMTGIVNGLVADGLARRRPHAQDRRSVLVEATARGRKRLNDARLQRIELVASRLDELPTAELARLRRAGEQLEALFALRPWQPASRD